MIENIIMLAVMQTESRCELLVVNITKTHVCHPRKHAVMCQHRPGAGT